MKLQTDRTNVKQAVSASNWAAGLVVTQKVDATGYGRARFIFSLGPGGGTASLSTGALIFCGSTSGAITSSLPTAVLAAVTSGALSSANYMAQIDTKIIDGYPWLQVSALSVLSTAIILSAVVELYEGTRKYAPTQTPSQTVVA
jgi:hypothetical protein